MSEEKKIILMSWIVYFLIGLTVFLLMFFLRDGATNRVALVDAFFLASAIEFGAGLIGLAVHFGGLDFLAYGVRIVFTRMNPRYAVKDDKYSDFNDYVLQKREERTKRGFHPWPWLVFGTLLFVVFLILRFTLF